MDRGFQLLQVDAAVSSFEEEEFGKDPSFEIMLRSTAARQFAEIIAKDHSVHKRIEPTEDRKYIDPVIYRYTIAVMAKTDEISARLAEVARAERRGLHLAAASAIARAQRLRNTGHGGCLHVIAHELEEFARELQSQ